MENNFAKLLKFGNFGVFFIFSMFSIGRESFRVDSQIFILNLSALVPSDSSADFYQLYFSLFLWIFFLQ